MVVFKRYPFNCNKTCKQYKKKQLFDTNDRKLSTLLLSIFVFLNLSALAGDFLLLDQKDGTVSKTLLKNTKIKAPWQETFAGATDGDVRGGRKIGINICSIHHPIYDCYSFFQRRSRGSSGGGFAEKWIRAGEFFF